ncbi:uncharacterized protein TRAVEDRAFT_50787 [Trametes versicolor FP-101664 SS1]|uniref:uncharacterized protein n=1 Tax=Trametes versicolor (strain FP-101664) TaxID=717944 RepID=UPI0004623818|nr:uncharacterized protein TRAVEDRAFT_50787 [Trametes versicolor FP-101664 SS1]EIW54649.1 hypothetical protein TRAVEDRAFT_50787 [Trametes versicolor FP-101664 SS1]
MFTETQKMLFFALVYRQWHVCHTGCSTNKHSRQQAMQGWVRRESTVASAYIEQAAKDTVLGDQAWVLTGICSALRGFVLWGDTPYWQSQG